MIASRLVPFLRLELLVVASICSILELGVFPNGALAEDWPQILGPNRNGSTIDAIAAWGDDGPRLAWRQSVGTGYAGVAVANGLVIGFHREDGGEILEAWDAKTGAPAWRTTFTATYRGGTNSDKGPRCVPLIADGRVYGFGAGGDMHAVDMKTGKKLWSRALGKEYRALDGYFGFGSTPIHIAGLVLVNVGGGREDAGIVGLDPATGKTQWKLGRDNASYSSPSTIMWAGKPHAVFVTRLHCVVVEPKTGKEVFRMRFGRTGPTVNAATPLVFDNKLFLSASYGIGAMLLKKSAEGDMETVWENDTTMSSQYTTSVHKDGLLFGIHGREDGGRGSLRCLDAATGKVRWQQASPVGHVLLAKNQLLVVDVEGGMRVLEASGEAAREKAKFQLGGGVWRAIPAIADGRIYVRDSERGEIRCYAP